MTSCQKHENHQKSPKSWFFAIFSGKSCIFLAMMCVKVCLHMFLLQINQINKIKHRESVSWEQKNTICSYLCVISIENQFLVSFSLDPALYYATPRHNPRSDFIKNDLKSSARLEGKNSWSFSAKNNYAPRSFRVNGFKYEPITFQLFKIKFKLFPMHILLHEGVKTLILNKRVRHFLPVGVQGERLNGNP